MLPQPDGRRVSGERVAGEKADSSTGRACRLVQVGLTIYLMPVIAVVLLVGWTAVVTDNLARAARRMATRQTDAPIAGPKSGKSDLRPHLAGRPGRSRVV